LFGSTLIVAVPLTPSTISPPQPTLTSVSEQLLVLTIGNIRAVSALT
jgi:hypothetical protein